MKAFPFLHKHPTTGETTLDQGMDLRDWFAGMALQSVIANYIDEDVTKNHQFYTACACYEYADAMMKARENKYE
jgi:hypothetical protein